MLKCSAPICWGRIFRNGAADMGCNGNAVPDMGGGHMSESLYDFCLKYDRQYLLEEWDNEKNLPLTSQDVTHGSHR